MVDKLHRYDEGVALAMRKAYERDLKGLPTLAKEFGVSMTTARNWLLKVGTPMRPTTSSANYLTKAERAEQTTPPPEVAAARASVNKLGRQYVTTCPECRCGIFTGDPVRREPPGTPGRRPGPLHDWC